MPLGYEPPNDSLLSELASVSEDAGALVDFLNRQNILPATFPTVPLIAIGQSLFDLPNGSAEGCRKPLEYARVRLPAIRREHFLKEDAEAIRLDEEEEPPLLRGMTLDRLMKNLIASVTTALDEYRDQARQHFDDTIRAEPTAELDDMSTRQAIATSLKLEIDVAATADDISKNAMPGSTNIERLTRRLSDANSLFRAVRAELQFKRVVLRWYHELADGVKALPRLIGAAGDAIKLGVDLARPLAEWWLETERRVTELAFQEIASFGDALTSIEAVLERRQEHGRLSTGEEERDPRAIQAEKKARHLMLEGEVPPPEVARLVEQLDLTSDTRRTNIIPKPELLSHYPNLRELDIRRTSMKSGGGYGSSI